MKKISLRVLDEYANSLTTNQVNKLYEHKLNKKYNKKIYEFDAYAKNLYKLYLNEFLITEETNMNKTEFLMFLTENNSKIMSKITYKLDEDAINFNATSRQDYANLLVALTEAGIAGETLKGQLDEKYN